MYPTNHRGMRPIESPRLLASIQEMQARTLPEDIELNQRIMLIRKIFLLNEPTHDATIFQDHEEKISRPLNLLSQRHCTRLKTLLIHILEFSFKNLKSLIARVRRTHFSWSAS